MTIITSTNTSQATQSQASQVATANSSTSAAPLAYHTGLLIR